jgi:hypothetical protein
VKIFNEYRFTPCQVAENMEVVRQVREVSRKYLTSQYGFFTILTLWHTVPVERVLQHTYGV